MFPVYPIYNPNFTVLNRLWGVISKGVGVSPLGSPFRRLNPRFNILTLGRERLQGIIHLSGAHGA